MTFNNLNEARAALADCLRRDCAAYIERLHTQSPIVSDSHHWLRGLYRTYGKTAADAEIERQFAEARGD